MGSNVSSAPFDHVQWQWKLTELQIFKNHVAIITKITKSTVKKWSFALLLLTNPLPYTIRRIISLGVVAIGGLLS
jgi:hypothetical protein